MDIFYDMSLYKLKQKNKIKKVDMQLQSAIILDYSSFTVAGKKKFEEEGELCLESFNQNVKYACLRSNLVVFTTRCGTTYVLKNRYGDIGIVKTGE